MPGKCTFVPYRLRMQFYFAALSMLISILGLVSAQDIPGVPSCASSCAPFICSKLGLPNDQTCWCEYLTSLGYCFGYECSSSAQKADAANVISTLVSMCRIFLSEDVSLMIVPYYGTVAPATILFTEIPPSGATTVASATTTPSSTIRTPTGTSSSITAPAKSSAGRNWNGTFQAMLLMMIFAMMAIKFW
jgi:hypothetical protein